AAGSFAVMHTAHRLGREFVGCDIAYEFIPREEPNNTLAARDPAMTAIDEFFRGYHTAEQRILAARRGEIAPDALPATRAQRSPKIMNTKNQSLTSTAALNIVDGFDANQQDPTASPIRGVSIRFKDGDYLAFGDEINVRDRSFVVFDRLEGWQK